METTPYEAILQFERGAWLGGRFPFSICSHYLQTNTRAALVRWALSAKVDAAAVYAGIYAGTGADPYGHLVRLRYLSGPTGAHHGLRLIRARIVSYLVHVIPARLMAREHLSRDWDEPMCPKKQRLGADSSS